MAKAGVGWRLHLLSPTEVASRPPEGGLGAAATISRADALRRIPSLLLGGSTTDPGPSQVPFRPGIRSLTSRGRSVTRPIGRSMPVVRKTRPDVLVRSLNSSTAEHAEPEADAERRCRQGSA